MNSTVFAVDLGGSKISLLARELQSDCDVYADKMPTPARAGVAGILEAIDRHVENAPGGRGSMAALGMAVPGPVDLEGRVLHAGNLKGWVNVPLRSLLERRYRVPIFVERDAICGALGEKWCGAATSLRDFAFLALGTGVGGGLFVDGRVYRGARFSAGELGNLTFPEGNANWSKRLSELVGKKAIARKVKRRTGQDLSAAKALAKARRQPRLAKATRAAVDALSAAIVAVCAVLDPEAVLLGGGTSEAGEALFERLRSRLARHPAVGARLLRAGLGSDAQLYGALWGARNLVSSTRSAEPDG